MIAGATGVLPPPPGCLQRLLDICTRHGSLLIFDELITAFGCPGAPTASELWNVTPDIRTMARGLTNAAVPVKLFHGPAYSGHPLAAAPHWPCAGPMRPTA